MNWTTEMYETTHSTFDDLQFQFENTTKNVSAEEPGKKTFTFESIFFVNSSQLFEKDMLMFCLGGDNSFGQFSLWQCQQQQHVAI